MLLPLRIGHQNALTWSHESQSMLQRGRSPDQVVRQPRARAIGSYQFQRSQGPAQLLAICGTHFAERKPEFCINHTHEIQGGLDRNRIGLEKKVFEELKITQVDSHGVCRSFSQKVVDEFRYP